MVMDERNYLQIVSEAYRYGFQNQEHDNELWSGAVSYKYRVEDPRLGRFFSVDPLAAKYPHNSVYAFSENRVIDGVELEGLEYVDAKTGKALGPARKELAKDNNGVLKPNQSTEENSNNEESENNESTSTPAPNLTSSGEREVHFSPEWPNITLNLQVGAMAKIRTPLINAGYDFASTKVVGWDEGKFYLAGRNLTEGSINSEMEINSGYSLSTKLWNGLSPLKAPKVLRSGETGFSLEETRLGSRNGPLQSKKTTVTTFEFFYINQTFDYQTGITKTTAGLSFDFAIGIGLGVNTGVKWPLFSN
jgi:RHS repeat-associated protein